MRINDTGWFLVPLWTKDGPSQVGISQCEYAPISGHGRKRLGLVGSVVPKQQGGHQPGSQAPGKGADRPLTVWSWPIPGWQTVETQPMW
jgi:hypothetical protein